MKPFVSTMRSVVLLLLAVVFFGERVWGVYEFASSAHSYSVTALNTVNGGTISNSISLASGFRVKSGATVTWDFDGVNNPIVGLIVIEQNGVLNVNQRMQSSGGITVYGALNIIGGSFCGIINMGTVTVANGGTLRIANTAYHGFINSGTVNVENGGTLRIANTNTYSQNGYGLLNDGGSVSVADGGLLTIANTHDDVYGLYNAGGTVSVAGGGKITISSNATVANIYSGKIKKNNLPYILTKNFTVDDSKFSAYATGFYVASGGSLTWNASGTVNGPVVVEAGGTLTRGSNNTTSLNLGASGTFSNSGTLANIVVKKNNVRYVYADTEVTNASDYTAGFTVAKGVTVTWKATGEVNGPVVIENGGILTSGGVNTTSLNLGASGTLSNSGMLTNVVVKKNNVRYVYVDTLVTDATDYTAGFTVANGVTVTWDAQGAVNGPIIVEAGGTLKNAANATLSLGLSGSVVKGNAGAWLPYVINDVVVSNASRYTLGFYVADGARAMWNVKNATMVNGPIVVEGNGNVKIGAQGVLMTFSDAGSIKTSAGDPYTIAPKVVDDVSRTNEFIKGLAIGSAATVTFESSAMVNGAVTFYDGDSTLIMNRDLYLGSNGSLAAASAAVEGGAAITIDGKGNAIVFGQKQNLSNVTVNLASSLVLDGQGKTLTLAGMTQFAVASGTPALTLRNMTLRFSGIGPVFEGLDVTLENVTIVCDADAVLFSENAARTLTINGLVDVKVVGDSRLTLFGSNSADSNIVIAEHGILHIEPLAVVELSASATKPTVTNEGTIILDGCTLYTGSQGLTVNSGTVQLAGAVKVFNQKVDGDVNTDVEKALQFGAGVALVYDRGAHIDPVGLVVVE